MSTVRERVPGASARFLGLLPALLLAEAALGLWSLSAALPPGGRAGEGSLRIVAAALAGGILLLLRALPLLWLASWPLLRLRSARARLLGVGALWTAWLVARIALEQYYLAARVPLGADLFGYAFAELRTTVGAGLRTDALALAGWLLPPAVLWAVLAALSRRPPRARRMPGAVLALACAAAWWPALQPAAAAWPDEDAYLLALDKPAYFVAETLHHVRPGDDDGLPAAPVASAQAATAPADPRHPFLHEERTPDVLGPLFADGGRPPNLVFIVVEGLGRSFSGPGAALGSFTPFLDELAARGVYFDNFLANQGRTFAVLPSLFGSLPFGEEGFAALGDRMPPHADLFSLLGAQGYRTAFYTGTDAAFDNERAYLQRQGVQRIVDLAGFGAGYPRSPGADNWGYADGELVRRVLADAAAGGGAPTLRVIQTITMHTPYTFPGQAAYRARLEQRLRELGIAEPERARYRAFAQIYESVLYTDDALRAFFAAEARTPGYANTLYIITGDHRLPELPMGNRIERYHVPLLVFSPLLRHPLRVRGVSSHLDVAPSLLAFLAHRHGLRRPARATWLGSGLDLSPVFRNVHDIPLKQTKTLLTDFASGPWFLNRGQLYSLSDGMQVEPANAPAVAAQLEARFAAFRAANARFVREGALSPEGASPALVAYVDAPAAPAASVAVAGPPFAVRAVGLPDAAVAGPFELSAEFANDAGTATPAFVPLVVLTGEDGRERGEYYGAPLRLPAHAARTVAIRADLTGLAPGRYYVAVLPSHPDTGRSLGAGRYHLPLQVRAAGAP